MAAFLNRDAGESPDRKKGIVDYYVHREHVLECRLFDLRRRRMGGIDF